MEWDDLIEYCKRRNLSPQEAMWRLKMLAVFENMLDTLKDDENEDKY